MGADAIMPVAGPQTIDTVQEIKNQHSKCIVVGVDTAQEESKTVNDKSSFTDATGNNDIIKFSAVKQIANMVNYIG
jgi:basic membrane lipoprotein Med (substrate-binding protein (PBP1-ABC) superfamily)